MFWYIIIAFLVKLIKYKCEEQDSFFYIKKYTVEIKSVWFILILKITHFNFFGFVGYFLLFKIIFEVKTHYPLLKNIAFGLKKNLYIYKKKKIFDWLRDMCKNIDFSLLTIRLFTSMPELSWCVQGRRRVLAFYFSLCKPTISLTWSLLVKHRKVYFFFYTFYVVRRSISCLWIQ